MHKQMSTCHLCRDALTNHHLNFSAVVPLLVYLISGDTFAVHPRSEPFPSNRCR